MPNKNLLWFSWGHLVLYNSHEVSIFESGECSEIKQYITFFDQMPAAIGE